MTRVLVLNNYPLESVWAEVRSGAKPDHHLFGLNYFSEYGFEASIVPYRLNNGLQKLETLLARARFPIPLGDLDQEWSAFQALNEADLIYAPCQTQTHVLGYLRAIGLLRLPIVNVAHHPLQRGRLDWLRRPFTRWFVHGIDAFPSLSRHVANEINTLSKDPHRSLPLQWGPQRDYYPQSDIGSGFLCAGRTGRDFETFARGAAAANVPAELVCLKSSITGNLEGIVRQAPNVRLNVQPDVGYMSYPQLNALAAKALAIAIPMFDVEHLCGLTSLTDAMAMGKPVVVTRNACLDIDVEREGIGYWVAPGDVDGWALRMRQLQDDPNLAEAMGRRARKLVENGFNSSSFARSLVRVFEQVLSGKQRVSRVASHLTSEQAESN
jgi:glycosyltransferase involved in cell wall biosynthesis